VLPPVPDGFRRSRDGLHVLAFYVVSAARRARTGRLGLRWTPGGFGTPPFDGTQIRVEGLELVVDDLRGRRRAPITTLADAGLLIGIDPDPADKAAFDVPDMPPPDAPLAISEAAVAFLDAWLGLGTRVLERLGSAEADREPNPPTLWPEHFDLAIELGDESRAERATFGVSPGDRDHDQPYAYVSAWRAVDHRDAYWNDRSFSGASVPYADIAAADDPEQRLLDFFGRGRAALSRPAPR
jgi:hypothetical protein